MIESEDWRNSYIHVRSSSSSPSNTKGNSSFNAHYLNEFPINLKQIILPHAISLWRILQLVEWLMNPSSFCSYTDHLKVYFTKSLPQTFLVQPDTQKHTRTFVMINSLFNFTTCTTTLDGIGGNIQVGKLILLFIKNHVWAWRFYFETIIILGP